MCIDLINPDKLEMNYTLLHNRRVPNYIYADDGFGNLKFTLGTCEYNYRKLINTFLFDQEGH